MNDSRLKYSVQIVTRPRQGLGSPSHDSIAKIIFDVRRPPHQS